VSGARLPVATRVGGAFAFILAAVLLVACGGGGNGDAGEPPASATARGTDGGGVGNPSEPPSASALASEPLLREGCRERGGYCGMLTPGGQLTAAAWLDHDRMYLADLEGRIRLLNVGTGEIWTVRTGLSMPQGLTVLHGRLYVTDMGSVCQGMWEEKEKLEAAGMEVLPQCRLVFPIPPPDALGEHLERYIARVLSYRVNERGILDDEQVIADRIISLDRQHSPNGMTNDGEYVYVSLGHPINRPTKDLIQYFIQLRERSLRTDLMGVIARIDSRGRVDIYARGFRNVYGISVAPDGTIYGADNDVGDGLNTSGYLEELNAIREGEFYGFPVYGTNEAPPDANVTEPVAILPGFSSVATYANEDGVYVAYIKSENDAIGKVVERFDYETFDPTLIYEEDVLTTAIIEQDNLLYLITLEGHIYVIDPEDTPILFGMRLSTNELDRILASDPIIVSSYNVYLDNSRLIYIKDNCEEEMKAFFLHITPVKVDDLPEERRVHGFDNLDFAFDRHGRVANSRCFALRYLPSYEFTFLTTGQYIVHEVDGQTMFETVWLERIYFPIHKLVSIELDRILASDPVIRSQYDVYLDNSRLIYIKDTCDEESESFSLHVYPADADDLPEERRMHGFDNLDFTIDRYGMITNGMCVAVRYLPDYDIASLTTGQYIVREVDGQTTFETIWSEDLSFQE